MCTVGSGGTQQLGRGTHLQTPARSCSLTMGTSACPALAACSAPPPTRSPTVLHPAAPPVKIGHRWSEAPNQLSESCTVHKDGERCTHTFGKPSGERAARTCGWLASEAGGGGTAPVPLWARVEGGVVHSTPLPTGDMLDGGLTAPPVPQPCSSTHTWRCLFGSLLIVHCTILHRSVDGVRILRRVRLANSHALAGSTKALSVRCTGSRILDQSS